MKRIIKYIALLLLLVSAGFFYFFYNTTIMFVQTIPNDSLAIGRDRSLHEGDTVTVTGRVIAPCVVNASGNDFRILTRGQNSRTIYLQDTTNSLFGGISVRQADTVSNTGITNLDSGMKVTLTGIVQEFSAPPGVPNTTTQLKLDTLSIIQLLPTIKKRPAPIQVNVSDFDSLGRVEFLTGEKYEGMYVQLNNVTIGPQSPNGARNIRSLIDAQGNRIYLRDFSNFYSIVPMPVWGWTPWNPPSIGSTVTYIRGVIIEGAYAADGTFNGQERYPYVIVPIYPNDLLLGNTPPFISSVSRNPGVPRPANTVTVTAAVYDTLDNSVSVDSCQMWYRINRGVYTRVTMSPSGNIYSGQIPQQSLNTLVEYFIKAKDNQGGMRMNPSDTSRSAYFYYVRSSDTMSIKDVQYTPNNGGFSAYNGYDITTEGVVSCDTSDIPAFSFTSPGGSQSSPRRVIIQDPAIPGGWSGIWVSGNAADALVKGQRIRVRGTVSEANGMTSITTAASGDIQILASGQTLPAFENLTPAVVANHKLDGDTTAEKWESVLIKFPSQVVISCINAPANFGCTSEYPVTDTTFRRNFGEIFIVQPGENIEARIELQDGNHNKVNGWDPLLAHYYNQNGPGQLLWKWDGIGFLQGVLYYSSGHYMLVPRKDADFGNIIGIEPIGEVTTQFWLRQNYPNPFNPVTNIVYNLPVSSDVTVTVYNLLGQHVKILVDGIQNKGKYDIRFDGTGLASGMYIYVLEANTFEGTSFRDAKKIVLVK